MPDFDTDLDRAWREFCRTLADRLADLPKGAGFELWCDDAREGVSLECRITGRNRIRVELPPDSCPVDAEALSGWRVLRSGASVLEVGRRWADLAADRVVAILRVEWGILHPSFVHGHDDPPELPEARMHLGIVPHSREHLQQLVDAALESMVCGGPEHDVCGCIRFELGGMPSWLRVLPDEKTLQFFTWLGPAGAPQAAHVVASANLRRRGVQVAAADDRVFAALHVDAAVFVASDLARALHRWLVFMDNDAREIAGELDGVAEAAAPAALPVGLQCLLQLDPEASMSPADVATVCGNDRAAIVDYLRICSEQEATWRTAAADAAGDVTAAEAADHEAISWARTAVTLRAALRLVVFDPGRSADG